MEVVGGCLGAAPFNLRWRLCIVLPRNHLPTGERGGVGGQRERDRERAREKEWGGGREREEESKRGRERENPQLQHIKTFPMSF